MRHTAVRCSAKAINELLAGKSLLLDYINATIGFAALADDFGKSSKSLQRMFGPSGNLTAENLLTILKVLQEHESVQIRVKQTCELA